jgi:hypothetical protein
LANKKEGKLFNYLSSPTLSQEIEGKYVTESLDNKGWAYVEYSYGVSQPVVS